MISCAAWESGEQSEPTKTLDSKKHLHGFCRTVQLLLVMQSKLNESTQRNLRSLLCSNDSFRIVSSSTFDKLLKAVAHFSISDGDIFIRAAQYAFKEGFQDLAEMFVRSESKTDLRTYTFGLFYSTKHNWSDMYDYLMRNGVDVDSEIDGQSAVLRSCRERNFEMEHFLIKLGAKLKERNFLTVNGRFYYFMGRNKHHPIHNYTEFSVKIYQNGYCSVALLYPSVLQNDQSFQHILEVAENIVEHPRDYCCEESTTRAETGDEVMKIVVTEIASRTVMDLFTLDLHCCARMGLTEGLSFLLTTDIDVEFVRHGKTALMVACEEGLQACVDCLIRRGASIDIDWLFPLNDEHSNSVKLHRAGKEVDISACVAKLCKAVLFRAIADQDVETTGLLLSRGWNVDMLNEEGDTPLSFSCAKGNVTMVEFLVSHGADLEFHRRDENKSCGCVFMLFISSSDYDTSQHSSQVSAALVRKILQEIKKEPDQQRLVAEAVFAHGSLYMAEILIEVENCDTLKSYDFLMPLCIKRNWFEIVRRALTDKDNETWNQIRNDFFFSVVTDGEKQVVEFLLENEPSLKDRIDKRLIQSMLDKLRSTSGSPEFARYGLSLQALLACCNSAVDDLGDRGLKALLRVIKLHEATAVQELFQACEEYRLECLKLENNLFLHPVHDPLCIASRSGDVKSVEMLIANGADVNAIVFGETPLFYAMRGTYRQLGVDPVIIIEILLKAGADPNIGASAGGKKRRPLLKYALHLIRKDGVRPTSWKIIAMLAQYGTVLETSYNCRYLLTPWKAGSGLVRLIQRYNGVLYSVQASRFDLIRYLFLAGADLNLLLLVRNAHRQDNESYRVCTDLCKALVLSGSRICQSELEMIDYAFDTGKEFCLWYRREMQSPSTLQNTCRTFIRTHCREVWGKRSILPALNSLPLPNTLKRYLQFEGTFSEVDLMSDTEKNP